MSSDELVLALLRLSEHVRVTILDSCGVRHLGSHLLIAGVEPIESFEVSNVDPMRTLALLDDKVRGDAACVFTLSYDFGLKLLNIVPRAKEFASPAEPDLYLARFAALVVHDYDTGETKLAGHPDAVEALRQKLAAKGVDHSFETPARSTVTSNFTRDGYLQTIEQIKERIRCGDTYQKKKKQQYKNQKKIKHKQKKSFYRLRK